MHAIANRVCLGLSDGDSKCWIHDVNPGESNYAIGCRFIWFLLFYIERIVIDHKYIIQDVNK